MVVVVVVVVKAFVSLPLLLLTNAACLFLNLKEAYVSLITASTDAHTHKTHHETAV